MQFQVCESDDSCQPGAQYTNPRVVVEEHHGAPLLNCSGLVLVRQLIERLGVARAIDAGVRVLQRCKWYRESDHILTLIYSMISGGSRLQDVNRLGQDDALKRVLGSDRIPHATTIGPEGVVCPDSRAERTMRPWLCSNDHPREAGGTSVTHIANTHRTTIARPTKLPTFLLYSTVPVAQSAAVSLNLGYSIDPK